jgi:hypothetical protein
MARHARPLAGRRTRIIMTKTKFSVVIGLAAAAMLGGCAVDDGYHHHHPYMAGGIDYDGYYDGFYGPISDGYWGDDQAFYYTDAPGHPYRRDGGGHVRRVGGAGFQVIHGHHSDPAPRR